MLRLLVCCVVGVGATVRTTCVAPTVTTSSTQRIGTSILVFVVRKTLLGGKMLRSVAVRLQPNARVGVPVSFAGYHIERAFGMSRVSFLRGLIHVVSRI